MATNELQTRLTAAFEGIGADIGLLFTLATGGATDLAALTTAETASLVAALNGVQVELDALSGATSYTDADADARVQAAQGSLATPSLTEWANTQEIADELAAQVAAAVAALVDGAPGALDTLRELAEFAEDNADAITNIMTAINNRLRFDAPQTLTPAQILQAGENLCIGDVTTDYLALYVASRDA